MTVIPAGRGPAVPHRNTELDDEIEQILRTRVDGFAALELRNRICDAIAARGFDVYAHPLPHHRSVRS
ncbi:hypothetical protein [Amycolatopsis vastitatis]|uniref:Uncharacterized protein n=1 Tax=Amycolatopsis vastitatis TaxID=1905142 RepID=A0A229TER7_9PSEU|nr:hypothetical protein [Amycolatopsis vastitatis]OXM69658.1 hypothetical protein CF165_09115 [Amycolatopsis vastitatis]